MGAPRQNGDSTRDSDDIHQPRGLSIPVFRGGTGPRPGVDLDSNRVLSEILDDGTELDQLRRSEQVRTDNCVRLLSVGQCEPARCTPDHAPCVHVVGTARV